MYVKVKQQFHNLGGEEMNTHEKIKSWEQNNCVEILKLMGVKEGDYLIDFGCGFGHYTFPSSIVVGNNGKVFAIEKNKDILNYIKDTIEKEDISNITPVHTKGTYALDFEDSSIDCLLLYDILHGEFDRFSLIKECSRTLKHHGILSVLPFHLSNFRDKSGTKKKYKAEQLINEIIELGFKFLSKLEDCGVHFEKYHSPHYIKDGGIEFEELERGTIYNFKKI
jgi:ubiquinone/menaquinone biosynthesis C-methylase UbiE